MNWLIALACVVGGWMAHGWLDKLRDWAARRIKREVLLSQGWIDCGLEAFGFPPDGLTVAAQAAANAEAMNAAADAVIAEMRRYCPTCGEKPKTPRDVSWLCARHMAMIRPATAQVLVLPPLEAHLITRSPDEVN